MIHGPLERSDKMWLSIYFPGEEEGLTGVFASASLNLSDEFDT